MAAPATTMLEIVEVNFQDGGNGCIELCPGCVTLHQILIKATKSVRHTHNQQQKKA